MTTRGSQAIGWDVENRVISVDGASFVYDGDGNRVMKTENGETILYVNQYYEKNLDTGVVTTYYYLSGKLVAMRPGTELKYMHQDHLSSTSVMTDGSGDSLGAIKYLPFGETRSGSVPTDKQFTGQRLDDTGLYYYGARYYDATMGRFISPDTIVPNPANPQSYNRYSYCLNNPLKYIDPSGNIVTINGWDVTTIDAVMNSGDWWMMGYVAEVVTSLEFQAYDAIRSIDRTLTDALESDDMTIEISSDSLDIPRWEKDPNTGEVKPTGWVGAECNIDVANSLITLTLNNDDALKKYGHVNLETYIKFMAHELVHAYGHTIDPQNKVDNSRFEENLGDLYSKLICNNAGIPYDKPIFPGLWSLFNHTEVDHFFPTPIIKYGGTPSDSSLYFWLLYLSIPR